MNIMTSSLTPKQKKDGYAYEKCMEQGEKAWTDANNSRGKLADVSTRHYNRGLKILQKYLGYNEISEWTIDRIELDTGVGLYPTIEVWRDNGKHYTIYNGADSFFKTINNFWNWE